MQVYRASNNNNIKDMLLSTIVRSVNGPYSRDSDTSSTASFL